MYQEDVENFCTYNEDEVDGVCTLDVLTVDRRTFTLSDIDSNNQGKRVQNRIAVFYFQKTIEKTKGKLVL